MGLGLPEHTRLPLGVILPITSGHNLFIFFPQPQVGENLAKVWASYSLDKNIQWRITPVRGVHAARTTRLQQFISSPGMVRTRSGYSPKPLNPKPYSACMCCGPSDEKLSRSNT